jgi:hypothetical protein
MAAPVWVLSVDLQTKTATFQSGMADAAKSARGAFNDIRSGSGEMSVDVGRSMTESREGVILLGEAFGVHLPRGVSSFIASVGPLGAALEAAFPFVAIAVGALTLLEIFSKMHEAGEKLSEDQMHFGTAAQNAFNMLDNKLLQAQIHADELRNDHLGALHKQLELIDKQSMAELVQSFEEVAKAGDTVFADLKSNWYTFGIGSDGAKHALTGFKSEYDSLLAQGKQNEAADLLKGTRESAERVLAMQKQGKAALAGMSGKAGTDTDDQAKYDQARIELKKAGVGWTEKEVAGQQTLVDALRAQESIQQKVSALKGLESANATKSTGNEMSKLQSDAAKQAAEHTLKMGELSIAAQREQANVRLALSHATIAEQLASDISLADKEYEIQLQANQQQTAALDKSSKDYQSQLRDLNNKAIELTAEHENQLAQLKGKASEEQARKDISDLEQSERDKIGATQQGSVARLAAIGAALKQEQSLNLQSTSFYRELLQQQTEVTEKAAEEAAKLKADAGKEAADNEEKMGALAAAAHKEQQALMDGARRMTIQQQMAEEIKNANDEFALKQTELAREIAALDKSGKDYENKLQALQDKQRQMIQQHENEVTDIKDKAERDRNTKVLSGEQQFNNQITNGLTQVIMGHKSFASMMSSIGNEVVAGLIQNAMQSIMAHKMTQIPDAAAAARAAYLSGVQAGGPFAPITGAVYGAEAFAAMMAFQNGTDRVPGIGTGDTVHAMLEPGEGVVPGGVMDGLRNMARSGTMGGGNHYHAHVSPTYHLQALDSSGMDKILDKHQNTLTKHVNNTLRKMNR